MRRLAWWLFALAFAMVPERCVHAQQGRVPVMTEASTPNDEKLNPALPWISEYRPPFIYQVWWAEIAKCEGLPLPMDSVRKVQYFQVNGPVFIPQDVDAIVYAVTYQNGQTFVAYPYIWNKSLISHEAAHLLLKWAGHPDWYLHDPNVFERCGLRAAGEPPPKQ